MAIAVACVSQARPTPPVDTFILSASLADKGGEIMLLEIMCVVIIALIYLVGRLKEIDFPAIAPTLRQMQYERLLSHLIDMTMGITWDTRVDNGFIRFENGETSPF